MQHGKIVELTDRSSGFIRRAGVADTLFFDSTDLKGVAIKDLKIGDTLSFSVTQSLKGPYATSVSKTA
jgi:cold shock CspA family protein